MPDRVVCLYDFAADELAALFAHRDVELVLLEGTEDAGRRRDELKRATVVISSLHRHRALTEWSPHLGEDLARLTVGIVGFGRIGRAVVRRLAGFGAGVLVFDARPVDGGDRQLELDELLRHSDAVSVHLPLNENTRALLDRDRAQPRPRPTETDARPSVTPTEPNEGTPGWTARQPPCRPTSSGPPWSRSAAGCCR